jgi:hypothetical protein
MQEVRDKMNGMSKAKILFERFLSALRVRQNAGGIEVSDQVLRFAYYDGALWQLQALRLAPDIVVDGRIKNKEAFRAALLELKSKIFRRKSGKKKVNVVASLSSTNVYSQVFSLPLLEGDSLEKAVGLNIQMISPVDISEMYTDWQILARNETTGQCDFLSVFIDRPIVDEMISALSEVGFATMAVESKGLVLARMLREKGKELDNAKSYVVASIDNVGIDFLIIRKGELYFEYMSQWRDLADEKGQISMEMFATTIEKSIHQVMNFYGQHWSDPVSGIFIISSALYEETRSAIAVSTSVPVVPCMFYFGGQEISPEWFVALGCGMRSIEFGKRKEEISLLSVSAEETFRRGQFVDFMDFWRIIVPVIFAFTIAMLVGIDIFLAQIKQSSMAEATAAFKNGSPAEITAALATASDFNRSVALIQTIENGAKPKIPIISVIEAAAASNGVSVTKISFQSGDGSVAFSGTAGSEDQIFSFEKNIQNNSDFANVDVPLSDIQKQMGGGVFVFTMTFSVAK